MRKAGLSGPRRPAPQLHAFLMGGGEVRTHRRPLYKHFCPVLPVYNDFRDLFFPVPENSNTLATVHHKLISAVWIPQPRAKVLFSCKGFNGWWIVFIIDPSLSAISLDVCKLVYCDSVLFIKGCAMERFSCCDSLLRRFVLDKCIPAEL